MRRLLLLACLPACTATLELEHPTGLDAGPVEAGVPPKPRLDAATDAADAAEPKPDQAPMAPACVDADGDGYGEHCAAGPDCDDARADVAPGAVERCNESDDDCDGEVDEGYPDLGRLCTAGLGACARPGMLRCSADGDAIFCDSHVGDPVLETCNGVDDDCDGEADEEVAACCQPGTSRPCGIDTGRCTPGEQSCTAELVWSACSGISPGPEDCNGVDDDCDGLSDEGTTNLCGQCGPTPDEICNRLDDDCDGAIDEGATNACGACGPVPDETCNDLDDDCDNRVDEGVTNRCGVCGPDPVERCNQQDDDCDNRVDEGVTNACGTCGAPPPELCNMLDDDCDGEIDEGTCAPAVDACAGLTPIRLGEVKTGPIGGAPANHRGGCGGTGPEVAFTFSPAAFQTVCASTEGSDFDTVIYVRHGACADGMELACNDDSPQLRTLQSTVQFDAQIVNAYHVFVDTFQANLMSGTYRLTITEGPCVAPAP